ncbi:hypothetical protein AX769_05765 [Frondihabitans sp. PAMC 28766]|uniref:RNA polymerase sigma factor n=1 Tax=Frondihabitans sp. PAMC 28766 TaxID=1795630 RepID=UPI00078C9F40|nr:RNA polymerase sigma factor [Frondihabitans sp. PAMC 28766]AMM19744.1 hypothetical protein AX769_05765 [Frondihabitans sp. PAMC 28766]
MTEDDSGLWHGAKSGDAEAFGALYDRHRARVFSQASRLLRSRLDAEDVTAMVFLEAWRKRDSVRLADDSILGWLLVTTNYTVANAARSARRHRAALAKIASQYEPPEFDGHQFEAVDGSSEAASVRKAFLSLKPQDRDVLTLCVLHEMPIAQAASVLSLPVGTVKSRLSRAKQKLAALTGSFDGTAVVTPSTEELS